MHTLSLRFTQNPHCHPTLTWADVEPRLTDAALRSLTEVERTGGEPVIDPNCVG